MSNKTPSPADRLAAERPRKRMPRNGGGTYPAVWDCRIRAKRESLNLSLRVTADAVGLSVSTLWQVEHGGDLMLATARRLADFFGCRVETLWPNLAVKG